MVNSWTASQRLGRKCGKNNFLFFQTLVPHLVQNFAPVLISAPHDLHPDCVVEPDISAGSGDGRVPGAENACCADTTDGGLPGVCEGITGTRPGIPIPGVPNPGIKPGDCVPPRLPAPDLSSAFLSSKITFIAKNSNAEYATV